MNDMRVNSVSRTIENQMISPIYSLNWRKVAKFAFFAFLLISVPILAYPLLRTSTSSPELQPLSTYRFAENNWSLRIPASCMNLQKELGNEELSKKLLSHDLIWNPPKHDSSSFTSFVSDSMTGEKIAVYKPNDYSASVGDYVASLVFKEAL